MPTPTHISRVKVPFNRQVKSKLSSSMVAARETAKVSHSIAEFSLNLTGQVSSPVRICPSRMLVSSLRLTFPRAMISRMIPTLPDCWTTELDERLPIPPSEFPIPSFSMYRWRTALVFPPFLLVSTFQCSFFWISFLFFSAFLSLFPSHK